MRSLVLALTLGLASVALADSISVPDCVSFDKKSDYRAYGYTHAVEVENGCDEAIECTASSDSAPEPVTFRVRAGESYTRTLKIGAPGSAFELRLRCAKR